MAVPVQLPPPKMQSTNSLPSPLSFGRTASAAGFAAADVLDFAAAGFADVDVTVLITVVNPVP